WFDVNRLDLMHDRIGEGGRSKDDHTGHRQEKPLHAGLLFSTIPDLKTRHASDGSCATELEGTRINDCALFYGFQYGLIVTFHNEAPWIMETKAPILSKSKKSAEIL